jgi:hypothetical protein
MTQGIFCGSVTHHLSSSLTIMAGDVEKAFLLCGEKPNDISWRRLQGLSAADIRIGGRMEGYRHTSIGFTDKTEEIRLK